MHLGSMSRVSSQLEPHASVLLVHALAKRTVVAVEPDGIDIVVQWRRRPQVATLQHELRRSLLAEFHPSFENVVHGDTEGVIIFHLKAILGPTVNWRWRERETLTRLKVGRHGIAPHGRVAQKVALITIQYGPEIRIIDATVRAHAMHINHVGRRNQRYDLGVVAVQAAFPIIVIIFPRCVITDIIKDGCQVLVVAVDLNEFLSHPPLECAREKSSLDGIDEEFGNVNAPLAHGHFRRIDGDRNAHD
mmetsp:Transcript_10545/g.21428  ORF Transcript_10545/g.21428 Transcript_10545/m.21428 type:complete len:247 (-) Transcript_10545:1279-2019(-)